jgi:amino acid adenylation domain-containing protein
MHPYLLHHLLEISAEKYPEQNAVILKESSITYEDLYFKSNQLAQALIALGVQKGDRVSLMLNKSIESVVAIFGVLMAGASYVPIDPAAPVNRIKYIINNCDSEILITSGGGASKIATELNTASSLKTVIMIGSDPQQLKEKHETLEFFSWETLFLNSKDKIQLPDISDTNPAYILHTSGSTGVPKGVVISHLNSLTFVNMAASFFDINKDDRLCSHAPIHFDLSVFDIFVAIRNGATIVLVPEMLPMFPIKLAEFIDDTKISVWNSVASVLSLLAERGRLGKYQFESLRLVLFSGDVLPVKYLRTLMTHMKNTQFLNIYGQTEANSSTFFGIDEIPDDDAYKIPIGEAFPNFEVFALDEHEKIITSPGEKGELYVSGSTVALGYWGDPEKTSEVFVQDPRPYSSQNKVYRTGDLVTRDDDGNYIFLGRKDHQVKSRGYRIQLDEIEAILNNHSDIKEAVVIAIPDELIGNRIISFVSLGDGAKVTETDIFDYCSTFLPSYMVPEKISLIDKLPRTPSGKFDRNLLTNNFISSN